MTSHHQCLIQAQLHLSTMFHQNFKNKTSFNIVKVLIPVHTDCHEELVSHHIELGRTDERSNYLEGVSV